jgi:hypothetical protein
VEEEWAGQTVREVLGKLGQLSGVSLVAAGPELAGQVVTAKTQGQTIGAVMKALSEQLKAQWTRTGQGYFLVARTKE